MKKFWLKFKKWILLVLGFGVITTAVIVGAPGDTTTIADVQTKYEQATEIKAKYQLSEVSLIKTDIKNAELDAYKGEPKDEVKITIGDNLPVGTFGADAEFKPNIELKRWNEVSFKIKTDNLLKDVATKDKSLKFEGDKIKFDTPKISFEMYDYTEGEGGYKYIWYLNEKPKSNIVQFQIESQGLDFFYQPPLTQVYQNGYSEEFQKEIVVSETQVKDLDGNVLVERPIEVVNSYAVYHSTKGGMNDAYGKDYKTGKAFHIFRPHLIDANGLEAWGKLSIDAKAGTYSVEIPQDFLDKAVYPIKSNDTFGYTTTPLSDYSVANWKYCYAFTGAAGTITGLSAFFASAQNQHQCLIIYDGTNRIEYSEDINIAGGRDQNWYSHTPQVGATVSAQTYYMGFYCDQYTSSGVQWGFDSDAGATNWYQSVSFTYPPSTTWSKTQSAQTRKFGIYATYTPSGGAAPVVEEPIIIIID